MALGHIGGAAGHRPIALNFDKHIDRIAAKAYSRIGLLFRGFVSRNLHVFRQA